MWCTKTVSQIEKELKTNIHDGLSDKEAHKRLSKYGENKLKDKKKESLIVKFLKQFNDFMIIILIITSIISAITTKIQGDKDLFKKVKQKNH